MSKIELLSPAGSLDKLKLAILYGADAVYLSGQYFGLRMAADNFSLQEIKKAISFAKQHQKKIYITLNAFLLDHDFIDLSEYLQNLEKLHPDAVICSDLGVIKFVQQYTSIPIHISTQTSTINSYTAKLWKNLGATRVILGRELTIQQAAKIKDKTQIEVEMFAHGALCMSYSGLCSLSTFIAGRDSNRGGCLQNCRHIFQLQNTLENQSLPCSKKNNAQFMSSKDLLGIYDLTEFIKYGIDAIKIEGRMKSLLYLATTTKIYARALQNIYSNKKFSNQEAFDELNKIPHRGYTTGALQKAYTQSSVYDSQENSTNYNMAGLVIEIHQKNHQFILYVKNKLTSDTQIEILPFNGHPIKISLEKMQNIFGEKINTAQPNNLIKLPLQNQINIHNIARISKSSNSSY